MISKRSQRRAQLERMKNRVRRIMRRWLGRNYSETEMSPRDVGRNTSTHARPCACSMCQADAREVPQARERAFYDTSDAD